MLKYHKDMVLQLEKGVFLILAILIASLDFFGLADFAYKVGINPMVFAGRRACPFLLAVLVTVSGQSIKAVLMNPVESLRNER